jgi:hypothetical protein
MGSLTWGYLERSRSTAALRQFGDFSSMWITSDLTTPLDLALRNNYDGIVE